MEMAIGGGLDALLRVVSPPGRDGQPHPCNASDWLMSSALLWGSPSSLEN